MEQTSAQDQMAVQNRRRSWLSYALKTAHNFFGPLFAVSLVIVLVVFLRDNLPRRGDLA